MLLYLSFTRCCPFGAGYEQQSAHLADLGSPGVGLAMGGGGAFEWNTIFSYKDANGNYKLPR